MFESKVIEPTKTERVTPIVFEPKKDGSLRICVDYWKLDVVAERNFFPILKMDNCIDLLEDSWIFSTSDAICSYCQEEIRNTDRDETAFTSHQGLYWLSCMLVGLCYWPGTIQQTMDVIILSVQW